MASDIAEIIFERTFPIPERVREEMGMTEQEWDDSRQAYVQRYKTEGPARNYAMGELYSMPGTSNITQLQGTETVVQTEETVIGMRHRRMGIFGGQAEKRVLYDKPTNVKLSGKILFPQTESTLTPEVIKEGLKNRGYECVTKTVEQIQAEKIRRLERRVRELEDTVDTKYAGHDYLA